LYTLKEKTAEDLVNEFAATLDSLPNKKNNKLSRDKASRDLIIMFV
jgi:hypothetical protein